jgi:hypothetical protein
MVGIKRGIHARYLEESLADSKSPVYVDYCYGVEYTMAGKSQSSGIKTASFFPGSPLDQVC